MNSAYSFFIALSVILLILTLLFDLNIFGWEREMMAGYGFLIYWPLVFLCLPVAASALIFSVKLFFVRGIKWDLLILSGYVPLLVYGQLELTGYNAYKKGSWAEPMFRAIVLSYIAFTFVFTLRQWLAALQRRRPSV